MKVTRESSSLDVGGPAYREIGFRKAKKAARINIRLYNDDILLVFETYCPR